MANSEAKESATVTRQTYGFTIILEGVPEVTDDMADALFEAGCDDATLVVREGVNHLGFDREADSLDEAIRSAIADVERAGVGLRVARVEPENPGPLHP